MRCPECGLQNCCGGEMSLDIERLTAEVERLETLCLRWLRKWQTEMDPTPEMLMAETLFRIGEITLAPGNWRTKDQVALNGMVSAVRDMDEALNIVAEIAAAMLRLSKNRKTDWDLHGYALALRGTIMDMGYLKDEP